MPLQPVKTPKTSPRYPRRTKAAFRKASAVVALSTAMLLGACDLFRTAGEPMPVQRPDDWVTSDPQGEPLGDPAPSSEPPVLPDRGAPDAAAAPSADSSSTPTSD